MTERRLGLLFAVTCLALLALIAAQVRRPDGSTALSRAARAVVAPLVGGVLGAARGVGGILDHYVTLVGARAERDRLARELAAAQARLARTRELELENLRLRTALGLARTTVFERAVVAEVIARPEHGPYRHAVIVDRGRADGVGPDWVVLDRGAVAGRVVRAERRRAEVLLLLDPDSGIAVRHREGRFTGILRGTGGTEARLARLDYVPRDQQVLAGDVLVTSGLDGIYPPGLLVGTVRRVRGDSPLTWTIDVEVAFDPASLETVLLLPPVGAVRGGDTDGAGEDDR
ncbi:MAG: hypothetical protein Kow0062_23910 [Acidobacteriota bacterium]